MKVHSSALKHGVKEHDAAQAAEWPLWIEPLDDGAPHRELRLGFDTSARLLETVVLMFEDGACKPLTCSVPEPHPASGSAGGCSPSRRLGRR